MLRRLIIIGVFTGVGQIFSLFAVKHLAANGSVQELKNLAQIDSYFQLLLAMIALGLQAGAIRDIALEPNWKDYFKKVQAARLTLSLFLFPIGIAGYYNPAYYIFFLSPILAMSGDYALYATGKPVMGSIVSCIRTVLPYLTILITSTIIYSGISYWYLAGTLFAYVLTNWFIARQFNMSVFYLPSMKSLQLYVNTIPLGIVNLCLYTIGLGLLIILPGFYSDTVVATAFVGLKFYVLVKGVLRLIHQAFIREMQSDDTCLKADQLSLLFTVTIAAALLIFPGSTIDFLFGVKFLEYKSFFLLLGGAAVLYAFNLSMATKAMLDRKDKQYTLLMTIAAIVTIVSAMILSVVYPNLLSVGFSVLLGELVFCAGLIVLMRGKNILIPRTQFLVFLIGLLAPIYVLRLFVDDSLLLNIISLTAFGLLAIFIHRRRFVTAINTTV